MKKWRCTVCGYIHTGAEPPDICPVCGADKTMFVEISLEEAARLEPKSPKPRKAGAPAPAPVKMGFITRQMVNHYAHPVSVHFPNGVLPLCLAFLTMAVLFNLVGFSFTTEGISITAEGLFFAAFLNLLGVTIIIPIVLFSGYVDWKYKYGGNFTRPFVTKMICGGIVLVIGVTLLIWRILGGDIFGWSAVSRWAFFLAHFVMLGAAGVAGYIGGEIVFGKYKNLKK